MASSNSNFLGRQAFKAAKELEEARKAGTAPPAVDSDGKIINPHIPEYISQAPWYVSQEGPSLKHQQNHNASKRKFDSLDKWLPRAQFAAPPATKYRKGACINCGAMTHTASACLERPRRRGAKLTGVSIKPDELIGEVNLDFEGKRDRWNGYDISDFKRVQKHYATLDAARNAIKAQKMDSALRNPNKTPGNDDDNDDNNPNNPDDDDDAYAEGAVVQETGEAAKTTVRNLRIREDTAKYLYNLDPNSAYYDPKSRSMRADPRPNLDSSDKDYLGDSFVRHSEDVASLARMQLHSMQARDAGRVVPHLVAEPSRAEAVFKKSEAKKEQVLRQRGDKILQKYGPQPHAEPESAIHGVEQTEAYVEYNSEGKVVNHSKVVVPVSKYAEDVYDKGHSTVWGSYFNKEAQWGYACCYQTQRNAVCTGEAGKKAAIEAEEEMDRRTAQLRAKRDPKSLTEQWKDLDGDERALRDVAARKRRDKGLHGDLVPKGDMEEYRLKRQIAEDPMANFLTKPKTEKD